MPTLKRMTLGIALAAVVVGVAICVSLLAFGWAEAAPGDREAHHDISLAVPNADPKGFYRDGDFYYVLDSADQRAYVYNWKTGVRNSIHEFTLDAVPTGGATASPAIVTYAVGRSIREHSTKYDFTLPGTGVDIRDVHWDGSHYYILTGASYRKYNRCSASCTLPINEVLNVNLHTDNDDPKALWIDGNTYVLDGDGTAYAYNSTGAYQVSSNVVFASPPTGALDADFLDPSVFVLAGTSLQAWDFDESIYLSNVNTPNPGGHRISVLDGTVALSLIHI